MDREAGLWVLIWGLLGNRARRMRTRRTRRTRMRIEDREAGVWVLIWGFPGNRGLALLVASPTTF